MKSTSKGVKKESDEIPVKKERLGSCGTTRIDQIDSVCCPSMTFKQTSPIHIRIVLFNNDVHNTKVLSSSVTRFISADR